MADNNAEKESGPPCPGPDVDDNDDGKAAAPPPPDNEGNPTNVSEPPVDQEAQTRFMERAISESARLRREAEKFQEKREQNTQRMAGGAARMAALTEEHHREHFSGECANPAQGAGADDA